MKSKCLFLLFCCTFWLGISTDVVAQDTLTVMTYNIYHGESPQIAGQSTVQEIGQFIEQVQPDFVALQEIDSMTTRMAKLNGGTPFVLADSLAVLTGMYASFGKAIDFEGGGYGIAMLSKNKVDVQKIRLPNPKEGEPRVLQILEGKTSSGNAIVFAGTHLDHQYEENRLAQVEAINQTMGDNNLPIILAGDFNFLPDSKGYEQMANHWMDAGQRFDKKNEPVLTFPSENPEKRIDYIWLSKNAKWEVLKYKTMDVRYSDHLPVMAKILIFP